ncbi:GALNT [Lepeophtheirus salmonis]|uniref:GALNT n=2 Tax=Lepeophtheirus salmonis TaxID=72036 RepID=A0A7R8CFU7_LEPSM|nr:GALNT [Lepeophtheirus salmonis]CAF2809681.1 GALNT [Lepeophtheirus salmonis]
MAGGLFAVDRKYFWESGSYDSAMEVWGGENLEMSFRIWQCGGVLETIPCSRTLMVSIQLELLKFGWMTTKDFFYLNRPDLKNTEIGDIQERLDFRKEKGCKPFKWFLENVYPQKYVPDDPTYVLGYGRIINPKSGNCIDTLQNEEKDEYDLGFYPCHSFSSASQFFSFSRKGEIRGEESCATIDLGEMRTHKVRMTPCNGLSIQKWEYVGNRFIHKDTRLCLEGIVGGEFLRSAPCKISSSQLWILENDYEES